ncbi:MAG: D-alanyl-D-alanine carboxypeptidase/D-alanyl-D-alanine-endopeptidase [Chroococcidiopsidaceae cyanobacterium CP_BM_RX_35]|nr:D-alanyl-D-alanine carboxypeptidase/D-alanyl-D-alanine-endopeptidase [Chroococcidiopsidaceae cyanobacterium CP_BM_RX_35]
MKFLIHRSLRAILLLTYSSNLFFCSCLTIRAAKASEVVCPAQLNTEIAAIVARPQLRRSRWGILIQTLSPALTIYSRDAQQYFVPASNAKLLTTAAALHHLGPQFQIRTSVYEQGDALRVVGRGDPSLTDTQLTELAQQLSRQGIRQVSQLIAEDDYFRGAAINPGWELEDVQADYGAPVNSLILNQNAVTLMLFPQTLGQPLRTVWADPIEAMQWQVEDRAITVKPDAPTFVDVSRNLGKPTLFLEGQLSVNSAPEAVSLAVLDPAAHFLQHFRTALAVQQIVTKQAMVATSSSLRSTTGRELAFVESPPLSQLLVETNQNSNNLYAEALLRTLGAKAGDASTMGTTEEVGLHAVSTTLTELGVDPTSYVLVDGSGLSRHNLVSPEAFVQTLRAMAQLPEAALYRASLPVAGMSGTLKNRFRNTAAQGILQAKTGSMSGVAAISGYLNTPNYEPLVFSMIVNQSDQSATTLRQALDEIVLLITELHHC